MLQEIILNLQSTEEISVVICDHQAIDLLKTCDRAVILSNGKVIASGSPNEVITDKDAKNQYFGDEFNINQFINVKKYRYKEKIKAFNKIISVSGAVISIRCVISFTSYRRN